jgi:hypothetical protein
MHWPHAAEALRVVAQLAMRPKVARERLFLFAGSCDRIVPRSKPSTSKHWGCSQLAWYSGGHFGFRREAPARPAARGARGNDARRT